MTDARPTRRALLSPWLALPLALLAGPGCTAGSLRDRIPWTSVTRRDETSRPASPAADSTASINQPLPPLPVPALSDRPAQPPARADNAPVTHLVSSPAPAAPVDTAVTRAGALAPETAVAAALPPRIKNDVEPEPPGDDILPAPREEKPEPPKKPAAAAPHVEQPPADPWKDGLERLRTLARSRAGEPGAAATLWSIRARALDAMPGEGEGLDDATTHDHLHLWDTLLAVLSQAAATETPDEAAAAAHLSQAVDALEALAPLRISDLRVCRKVVGYGHFETLDAASIRAGQPVIVYCEMTGLKYNPAPRGFRSQLASKIELYARGSDRPAWSQDLGTAEDLCRHRRRDYYVNYRLTFPASLPAGPYELKLSQTDLNDDRTVSSSLEVEVRP
jgi:hypothetical protein